MDILRQGETLTEVNENLKLIQHKGGLTFGTDAFLLAAFIREQKNAVAIDLGAGTGIISLLALCRGKVKRVFCVEVQEKFADIITRNAELNSFLFDGDSGISSICKDARELSHADTEGEVDVVFSNPPYMRTDSGKRNETDEKFIARHEVCGGIEDFCRAAAKMLKHGGSFYCVYRPDRLMDLVCALRSSRLEPKRMTFVHGRADSEPSMVLIESKLGGAPGLRVTEPLILVEADGSPTKTAIRIYDNCNFKSREDTK